MTMTQPSAPFTLSIAEWKAVLQANAAQLNQLATQVNLPDETTTQSAIDALERCKTVIRGWYAAALQVRQEMAARQRATQAASAAQTNGHDPSAKLTKSGKVKRKPGPKPKRDKHITEASQ